MSNSKDLFFNATQLYELMSKAWGFYFASPIEQELNKRQDFKVLDVGCDSGKWLLQVSKDYPLAKFFGSDKYPENFPKDFSQKNLQFIQGDVLEGLPFEDDTFDFVHGRCLLSRFTEKQWGEKVVDELIRVCKPGGWIELLDFDGFKSLGPNTRRLVVFVNNYFDHKGIDSNESIIEGTIPECFDANDQIKEKHEDVRVTPVGNWAGDCGKLAFDFLYTVFQLNYCWSGISDKDYELMLNQFAMEVDHYHSCLITVRVYCQKAF